MHWFVVPFRMITDARVLEPEFVPQEVAYRDAEIDALASALDPITRGETPEPVFLFGPSGTGKTCIAKYALDRLHETIIDLSHQYVNCWGDYTRYKTLYRVLEGVDKALDVHRQSTPTDALLDRVYEYDGPPYVVILDEVDQLADVDVLYDLYRAHNLSMVLIANREEDVFVQLDERLQSRLQSATRIRFDRYEMDALVGILRDRVRWGLREDAVSDKILRRIADAAAGDARIAIGILRRAAQHATEQELETVTERIVDSAVPKAKTELTQKNIEKLNDDQRVLYEIISDHGEIDPPDLYNEYRNRVDDSKTDRMLRYYLQKMQHYNLIVADGENRGRTYRVVDSEK